ncbi:MAG: glycosyltransferase family 2 protein [Pseudomonadota bacterium]
MSTQLAVVVPCYNEEAVLPATRQRLLGLLDKLAAAGTISAESEIYFVDDGSRDATWSLIEQYANADKRVRGIKLSRNHGHQNALLAGLLHADGDAIISIDADLQDDIDVMAEMIEAFQAGHDVVYGVRETRSRDSFAKRFFAESFYRVLRLMGVDIVFNHADFRLLSRRALSALAEFGEVNLFLRGVIPALGFPSTVVSYARSERLAGDSKYSIRGMLSLAARGVTSFSALPLRLIALLGVAIFGLTLVLSIWVLWTRLFSDAVVPGWASSVLPMYFLGGVQLLSIGVLGEYVARVYLETKRRPRFIIEKQL